jgi:ABC-type nitrate/sulfonate/bicarbonate transport system substrate-binding protein
MTIEAAKPAISTIWYTFCPVVSVSHIAYHQGWLKEEFTRDDIQVMHISNLPQECWRSHWSHRHKQLFRDGENIPPIWTKSEGVDTKVIGMYRIASRQCLVVRPNSPIATVKDLRGKRIALPRRLGYLVDFWRGNTKVGVVMALKANGLVAGDVKFVDIPIDAPDIAKKKWVDAPTECASMRFRIGWKLPRQAEVEALQSGHVDAMFSYAGEVTILEQSGLVKPIYDALNYPYWRLTINHDFPSTITVNTDFAENYPDLVIRWLKVLIKSGRWAGENYAEVVRTMATETRVSEEVVRKSYSPNFHRHLVPEISDQFIEALEIQKRFLKQHGFLSNNFDVKKWIDARYLDAALKELAE